LTARSNGTPLSARSNDIPSQPARSNGTTLLARSNDTPARSNEKRSSLANNEVLFALSPIERPPLTTIENRNLIQSKQH
jgi:hypothetical protein